MKKQRHGSRTQVRCPSTDRICVPLPLICLSKPLCTSEKKRLFALHGWRNTRCPVRLIFAKTVSKEEFAAHGKQSCGNGASCEHQPTFEERSDPEYRFSRDQATAKFTQMEMQERVQQEFVQQIIAAAKQEFGDVKRVIAADSLHQTVAAARGSLSCHEKPECQG